MKYGGRGCFPSAFVPGWKTSTCAPAIFIVSGMLLGTKSHGHRSVQMKMQRSTSGTDDLYPFFPPVPPEGEFIAERYGSLSRFSRLSSINAIPITAPFCCQFESRDSPPSCPSPAVFIFHKIGEEEENIAAAGKTRVYECALKKYEKENSGQHSLRPR